MADPINAVQRATVGVAGTRTRRTTSCCDHRARKRSIQSWRAANQQRADPAAGVSPSAESRAADVHASHDQQISGRRSATNFVRGNSAPDSGARCPETRTCGVTARLGSRRAPVASWRLKCARSTRPSARGRGKPSFAFGSWSMRTLGFLVPSRMQRDLRDRQRSRAWRRALLELSRLRHICENRSSAMTGRVLTAARSCRILSAVTLQAQQTIGELDLLLERLGQYLIAYESQLTTVVGRRTLRPIAGAAHGAFAGDDQPRAARLESEVAFLRLARRRHLVRRARCEARGRHAGGRGRQDT